MTLPAPCRAWMSGRRSCWSSTPSFDHDADLFSARQGCAGGDQYRSSLPSITLFDVPCRGLRRRRQRCCRRFSPTVCGRSVPADRVARGAGIDLHAVGVARRRGVPVESVPMYDPPTTVLSVVAIHDAVAGQRRQSPSPRIVLPSEPVVEIETIGPRFRRVVPSSSRYWRTGVAGLRRTVESLFAVIPDRAEAGEIVQTPLESPESLVGMLKTIHVGLLLSPSAAVMAFFCRPHRYRRCWSQVQTGSNREKNWWGHDWGRA